MLHCEQEEHLCTKEELEVSKDKCNNIRRRSMLNTTITATIIANIISAAATTTAITTTFTTTAITILYFYIITFTTDTITTATTITTTTTSTTFTTTTISISITTAITCCIYRSCRYDVIVMELDEMVAEGYYIPGKGPTEKLKIKKPSGK